MNVLNDDIPAQLLRPCRGSSLHRLVHSDSVRPFLKVMVMLKRCPKCNQSKDLSLFKRNRSRKDGHSSWCKECVKSAASTYAKTKKGQAAHNRRIKKYSQTEKGHLNTIVCHKKYRKKYPLKVAAHNALNNAIKAGKLVRHPCVVCGNPKSHGHHDDYNKPLDVRWLCRFHHREHHNKLKLKEA